MRLSSPYRCLQLIDEKRKKGGEITEIERSAGAGCGSGGGCEGGSCGGGDGGETEGKRKETAKEEDYKRKMEERYKKVPVNSSRERPPRPLNPDP